jgi:hypothetical protein
VGEILTISLQPVNSRAGAFERAGGVWLRAKHHADIASTPFTFDVRGKWPDKLSLDHKREIAEVHGKIMQGKV